MNDLLIFENIIRQFLDSRLHTGRVRISAIVLNQLVLDPVHPSRHGPNMTAEMVRQDAHRHLIGAEQARNRAVNAYLRVVVDRVLLVHLLAMLAFPHLMLRHHMIRHVRRQDGFVACGAGPVAHAHPLMRGFVGDAVRSTWKECAAHASYEAMIARVFEMMIEFTLLPGECTAECGIRTLIRGRIQGHEEIILCVGGRLV